MKPENHFIGLCSFELDFSYSNFSFAEAQEKLRDFDPLKVLQPLEKSLDDLHDQQAIICIDKIELEIELTNAENLESNLAKAIASHLQKMLIGSPSSPMISGAKSAESKDRSKAVLTKTLNDDFFAAEYHKLLDSRLIQGFETAEDFFPTKTNDSSEETLAVPHKAHSKNVELRHMSLEEYRLNAWFFFLEMGHLPAALSAYHWNLEDIQPDVEKISATQIEKIVRFFQQNNQIDLIVQRLVNQSSPEFVASLVVALAQYRIFDQGSAFVQEEIKQQNWVKHLHQLFQDHSPTALASSARPNNRPLDETLQEPDGKSSLASSTTHGATSSQTLAEFVQSAFKDGEEKIIPPSVNFFEQPNNSNQESSLYVENMGLILLHPYLPTFFEALGCLQGGQFNGNQGLEKAVQALHYLARGQPGAAEYQMVFEKILCGIPASFTLSRKIWLGEEDKKEADQMLQSFIHHWDKPGNMSLDTLRETFLQRAGKIILIDGTIQLQLAVQSIDILLNYLPFGIGFIQLPWMKKWIQTQWDHQIL